MNKKTVIILAILIFLAACLPQRAPLDIPFVQQEGPTCVPSQAVMALNYYYPERNYTLEQLDQMIGREGEKWAWFSQALPILIQEGLDANYYSLTPYEQLTPEYVLEYYGEDNGKLINDVTDWEGLTESINFLKTSRRYQKKKLPWSAVERAFRQGNVIMMIIDYNTLKGMPGLYSGHGVTITYINQTHVVFHNSAREPNQKAEKERFQEAWNAPGTDNDIIIIKGKIK
jgi:hypothetical protein